MNFEDYKQEGTYPEAPKKPCLGRKHTPEEVKQYAKDLQHYESLMVEYKKKIAERQKERYRLKEKFKEDLLQEYGYSKEDRVGLLIFQRAWELGHSSGFHDVASHFDDIDAFVEDIMKAKK